MPKQNFEKLLGKIVSGLYILTTKDNQHQSAILTSFVTLTGVANPFILKEVGFAEKRERSWV